MARVFFALWPDERCADRLHSLAGSLADRFGGRATQKETLHLTLAFVGNVNEDKLPDLLKVAGEVADEIESLARTSSDTSLMLLNRLGYWKHNRILWAGTTDCSQLLETLAEMLAGKLNERGYALPIRPFAPHITLVRKTKSFPQPSDLDVLEYAPIPWPFRDFVLLRSRLSSLGSAYECLGSWKLGNPSS